MNIEYKPKSAGAERQRRYATRHPDRMRLAELKKRLRNAKRRLADPEFDKKCREKENLKKQRQRLRKKEFIRDDYTQSISMVNFNDNNEFDIKESIKHEDLQSLNFNNFTEFDNDQEYNNYFSEFDHNVGEKINTNLLNERENCPINNFESRIGTAWTSLKSQNIFYDVTLVCDDKQIDTHKVVISSFSPVFKNILKLSVDPHPLIYLPGVKYKDLEHLLNFMYNGEIEINEQDFGHFLKFAEDFKIKGLTEDNGKQFILNKIVKDDQLRKQFILNKIVEDDPMSTNIVANVTGKDAKSITKYSGDESNLSEYKQSYGSGSPGQNEYTREKEVSCSICRKGFKNMNYLNKHSKKYHKYISIV